MTRRTKYGYGVGDLVVRRPEDGLFINSYWYVVEGSVRVPRVFEVLGVDTLHESVNLRSVEEPPIDYGSWDADRFQLADAQKELTDFLWGPMDISFKPGQLVRLNWSLEEVQVLEKSYKEYHNNNYRGNKPFKKDFVYEVGEQNVLYSASEETIKLKDFPMWASFYAHHFLPAELNLDAGELL